MEEKMIKHFCEALARVDSLTKRFDARDGSDAKCFSEFGLMFRIAEARDGKAAVRMTDISEQLHVTRPAATYIVKQLVDRGLVRRVTASDDKRVTYIEMTDEGRKVFDESMQRRLGYLRRAAERMGLERAETFGELFREFLEALSAEMEEN